MTWWGLWEAIQIVLLQYHLICVIHVLIKYGALNIFPWQFLSQHHCFMTPRCATSCDMNKGNTNGKLTGWRSRWQWFNWRRRRQQHAVTEQWKRHFSKQRKEERKRRQFQLRGGERLRMHGGHGERGWQKKTAVLSWYWDECDWSCYRNSDTD